jgi:P-type Mg2+ transporter
MGASSNFGNMLSMAVASLFLPFLPMLPTQILLNNLLYDFSEIVIPFDSVRPDATARPQVWDMHALIRFTAIIGPLSSLFDLLTFGGLVFIFHASPIEFRSTWFLESMATQILVIFIIRTNGRPWKDLPRAALVASSLVAAAWHAGRHRLPGRPLSRLRRASQKGGRGAKRSIVKAVAHNSKT